jgi:opacity protein-like surface antigen
MHLKSYFALILAFFLAGAANHALAQAASAATEAKLPLAIGAGFSGYDPDWGQGHLLGGTLWIDYIPDHVPAILRGIGVEVEARDLNYGRSSTESSNLREDVAGGGVIYSWPRYRNFRPYGKILMGFGNRDAEWGNGVRFHDSRTITIAGGGVEYRAFRSVWVRADYEYQFWPDMIYHGSKAVAGINPRGFTVGALYHFSHPHFR